jgi:hypothetical protein
MGAGRNAAYKLLLWGHVVSQSKCHMPNIPLPNIPPRIYRSERIPQLSTCSNFQQLAMVRPRRDIQIPLRCREKSPPQLLHENKQLKRRKIEPKNVDRNDVDQALTVIAAAPEYTNATPTLVSLELPQFKANYV